MAQSIIIIGPQGCGKTRNAKRLAKTYGLESIMDEITPDCILPKQDHLILTNTLTPDMRGMKVIQFADAMKAAKAQPTTKNTFDQTLRATESLPMRRPEVVTVAKRLRRENPSLSEMDCLVQAKALITREPTHHGLGSDLK